MIPLCTLKSYWGVWGSTHNAHLIWDRMPYFLPTGHLYTLPPACILQDLQGGFLQFVPHLHCYHRCLYLSSCFLAFRLRYGDAAHLSPAISPAVPLGRCYVSCFFLLGLHRTWAYLHVSRVLLSHLSPLSVTATCCHVTPPSLIHSPGLRWVHTYKFLLLIPSYLFLRLLSTSSAVYPRLQVFAG